MNLRRNSADLITSIGMSTRPKVQLPRVIDFDGIVQNYQEGKKWAQQQELYKQKNSQLTADDERRDALIQALLSMSPEM